MLLTIPLYTSDTDKGVDYDGSKWHGTSGAGSFRGDVATGGGEELALLAYRTGPPPAALVPAPSTRAWIEGTGDRFARRCLPLMMANQAGWFLLNRQTVHVTWDGGDSQEALRLEFPGGDPPSRP